MNTSQDPFAAEPSKLSILHLEDNVTDAALIHELLDGQWPGCRIHRVYTREDFLAAMGAGAFDLILSDFSMPQFDGLTALQLTRQQDSATPFIFLSGTIGEDNAVRALHQGATDYVIKDRLGRLIPAMQRALHEVREHRRRRQAESQVHEQADFLNKARDAIIVADLDRRIVYWNQGAQRVFGWPAEKAIGKTWTEIFGLPALAEIDIVQRALTGDEWRGEMALQDKTGKPLIVESHVTVIRDPAGEPKSHLIISTDVTEQRKLEKQFLQSQRLESIGILAGGIAHDLNNVLSPILMAVNLVESKTEDPAIRRLMGVLEKSALHGASLLRQVLAFARGADGERTEIQLRLLVREVATLLEETLPRAIAVETDLAPDLSLVIADSTQLNQVIMNLCINARDAMPAGGRLVIRGLDVTVGEAAVQAHPGVKPGPYVLIAVEDTGAGIPPEIIDRIFDPFFTTKGPGKGTGLGLSTVLGIVKRHGGFMEVQSEPGQGTKFSLYFPAVVATHPAGSIGGPASLPRGQGETILLIDDEESIRIVLGLILTQFGYRPLVADGGLAGLALYRQHRAEIKAVVTDMMMPAMQGAEVIAELRTIDPDVRVVAMSGVLEASGELAEVPGRLAFLHKPMTGESLLIALASVLSSVGRGSSS